MSHFGKIWKLMDADSALIKTLHLETQIPYPIAQALVNRNITTANQAKIYFNPSLRRLSDPFLLPDMDKAVERIQNALNDKEQIVIHGDYDVDGISSSALMIYVLKSMGGRVAAFIPHRLDDGYGFSKETLQQCIEKYQPKLIITVDCGTGSCEAVNAAHTLGIDVIITDHHEPSEDLAPALAVINPKLGKDIAGSHNLAGVGVAFKLCHALLKKQDTHSIDLRKFLYLVGLGTIADVVPLRDENRILAHAGIKNLNACQNPGILALKEVSGISGEMGSYHIGFLLGPRINATGRLNNPASSLELLLEPSPTKTIALAHLLDTTNRERQELEKNMLAKAILQIEKKYDLSKTYALIVYAVGWHPGVAGIVASRLVQRFYRPAIVIGFDEQGLGKGSCRSIEPFDLIAHLHKTRNHLKKYGGHKMAAGIELMHENLEFFINDFLGCAKETLHGETLIPTLHIDAQISLQDANKKMAEWIKKMEPFGPGNYVPIWEIKNLRAKYPPREVGKGHLKLTLSDGETCCEAIAFNWGQINSWPDVPVDVACQLDLNVFRGIETLQLKLLDVKETETN